jgi:hypothetical protein
MMRRVLLAMLLTFAAGTATAAELGRMFFTPAQRATLDAARKQNVRVEIGNDEAERPPASPAAAAPTAQTVRLNGVIQRSDGKNTVWLNNKPVTGSESGNLNVTTNRNDTRVKLQVPDSGRSMDLKVGQSAEILSGTIEESYKRRPPAPKAEEKPLLPGPGNDAAAVQKRTAEPAPDSLESSPRMQRKPRAGSRDAADDTPAGGGPGAR